MARFFKKVPNFRLPKYKMDEINHLETIEELDVEYTPELIAELKKKQMQQGFYAGTDYKTVKELFSLYHFLTKNLLFSHILYRQLYYHSHLSYMF